MKNIAFVFQSAPHGSSSGREGLDAILAISSLTESIGVFFIGDGVFQILSGQTPKKILSRDYITTFKVLPLYNVRTFLICSVSLQERGINQNSKFLLKSRILFPREIREELNKYRVILTF